jgi:hypothetical protein
MICQAFTSIWSFLNEQLISSIIGAGLGVYGALKIYNFTSEKETKSKESELLKLITDTLNKNKDLVLQMKSEISPQYVIFYNVDLTILDAVTSIKYQVIKDIELNRQIDNARYELEHLHRKVDLYLGTTYSTFVAIGGASTMRANLIKSIQDHIEIVLQTIQLPLDTIANKKLNKK